MHALERRTLHNDLIKPIDGKRNYQKWNISTIYTKGQNTYITLRKKFYISRFKREKGQNWFIKQRVNEWDKLSSHVINANATMSFRRTLNEFMIEASRR